MDRWAIRLPRRSVGEMSDRKPATGPEHGPQNLAEGYTPSPLFLKYLVLAQSTNFESDKESKAWTRAHESRKAIVDELFKRKTGNAGELFEKLYIWRMEAFEPGDDGHVYLNDRGPLSAYLDLVNELGFDWARTQFDDHYRDALRRSCDSKGERETESDSSFCDRFRLLNMTDTETVN